ncbi:MAG: thioredoxin-disulfide reductase [Candidatus Margulisbacteria bacterium]|nr:thioredoxin-disulfide reductase [Candidatus Margulisiibacteriota bacterium]
MTLKTQTKPKIKPAKKKDTSFDLIIIGGGPAGLTAALYAVRARVKVLLVEKMILGGMVSTTFNIENYPGFPEGISGMELSNRFQDQVRRLGLDIVWGNAIEIKNKKSEKEIIVDDKKFIAKALIIATGTEAAKLGVPGEDEFRGRGVSYCATCDGAFYKDKKVMVVGGGNSAIEEALFLTRYAKKISVIHRRDELRADKIIAERAIQDPKIYFFWHSTVEKISGKQKVEEVTLKDTHSNKTLKVPADGIFVYIGSKPNNELVKDIVKTDSHGFIITDENMKTSVNGIYAAGDIRVKSLKQVVTAVADGAIAAESARKYIEGNDK